MYLLGYDIGSSSIKVALVESSTGKTIARATYPDQEMAIMAPEPGWAEQDPELWWEYVQKATKILLEKASDNITIAGIGISYQMHGLVMVDHNQNCIRPAIIWCDSRAVSIGDKAFEQIGKQQCLTHLLNSPGNFTASKLMWVKTNEPELYAKIDKIMLPGDFIAMKMTGEISTTISGLSEGMFWDFKENRISEELLDYYGIARDLIPQAEVSIANHGKLTAKAAKLLGLNEGITVGYKAGDQPNNALSLGVLQPGQVAATGGTSGVVYGIRDQPTYDPKTRVNSFAHINHTEENHRIGVLLCINGAGIQYSWLRKILGESNKSYDQLEILASNVAVGSEGLRMIPFGNGAERIIENQNPGAHWMNLQFNIHQKSHLIRASLEGIAFSFVYGMEIMQEIGIDVSQIKVGNDNLFLSHIFSSTIATLLGCEIQMVETTGAVGAAKAAGVASGQYSSLEVAFRNPKIIRTYVADIDKTTYQDAYKEWKKDLKRILNS